MSRAPYKEQWELMHAIHDRCVQEAKEEQQGKVNRDGREPARLFCHGLPGSGKTQVMKWMAEYFEEVWGWVAGRHYVYLAPLNSMAARINGFTVHAWGEVPWCKSSATGNMTVQTGNSGSRGMSSMASKTEAVSYTHLTLPTIE